MPVEGGDGLMGRQILIVDDSASIRQMVTFTLTGAGYDVIEAVEAPGRRFVLGVQWHPEDFWNHGAAFAPLFAAFVEAAR